MNIGNIKTNAPSDILVNIAGNTDSKVQKTDGQGFSSALTDAKQSNVRRFAKAEQSSGNSDTEAPKSKDADVDKAVSKLSKKAKEITNARDSVDAGTEKIEGLEEEFKESVSKALGIEPEELESVMEELALTALELTEPSNILQVMVATTDAQNPYDVISDADLSAVYKEIVTAGETFLANASDMGITADDIKAYDELADADADADADTDTEETDFRLDVVKPEERPQTAEVKTESEGSSEGRSDTQAGAKEESDTAGKIVSNLNNSIREAFAVAESDAIAEAPVEAVDVDDVLRQVNESIRVNLTPDTKSLEIQLNPQNLGHVTIQVMSKNGVVSANVLATDEAVKKALETQLVTLKTNLENQGVKVENVEIVLAGRAFSQQDESNQGAFGQNSGRRRRSLSVDGGMEVEDVPVNESEESSDNIINYKA
ncbi:MAG TPA: hypothetical protein DCX21_00330 [Eubacterium sp.]|nr:hypothetical protein [Eubacterium sp.]HBZ53492.1 hypothetical protein [Eubacterium sp.]